MSSIGKTLPRRGKPSESQCPRQSQEPQQFQEPQPSTRPEGFRGGRAPGPNDVFIAVMGVTGSGKSSFISLCSGESVKIGHSLESCTSTVDIYAYDMSPERTVYLIDTPGFDDTTKSDTDVLSEIATWLVDSYRNKILLHGIIYLHRITDNRMQGSAKRNFLMFKKLCGPDALKRVILATTMWDRVLDGDGIDREKVLVDTPEFWGGMLSRGSSCHRHDNTVSSAKTIIGLLAGHDGPVATDLEKQLVDEHRPLDQTSAGRELHSEMLREKEKWERELREIEKEILVVVQQRDRESERLLREERDRYTRKISKVKGDTEKLRSTMEKLLADRDERVAAVEKRLQRQEDAYEGKLRWFQKQSQQLKQELDGVKEERDELKKERDWLEDMKDLAELRALRHELLAIPCPFTR